MLLSKHRAIKYTEKDEQEVTLLGSRRRHSFYLVGITTEIAKKYKNSVHAIVDNTFFAHTLKKSFKKEKRISVEPKRITLKLILELLEKKY